MNTRRLAVAVCAVLGLAAAAQARPDGTQPTPGTTPAATQPPVHAKHHAKKAHAKVAKHAAKHAAKHGRKHHKGTPAPATTAAPSTGKPA